MNQSRWAPQPAAEPERPEKPADATSTTEPVAQPALSSNDDPPVASSRSPAQEATVAPPASMYETVQPVPDIPEDSFAQTGAQQDDLFDDFTPMEEESMRLRSDDDLFNDDFTPAPEPEPEPVAEPKSALAIDEQPEQRNALQMPRTRGDGLRGRGRGRGRGTRGDHREQTRGSSLATQSNGGTPSSSLQTPGAGSLASGALATEQTLTSPRKETVPAVRGDRQATGGVRKPKLSEAELAAKMAQIQIKNASLTAAHARAEADAASFAEREQVAKQVADQRRKEERRDRQQMMGERERNRQRKLKAMEGREWDAEKRSEDFGKGGKFDKRGGFAGDQQDYTDGREYLYRESRGGGGGGGGDRGRGSRRGGKDGRPQEQAVPKQDDFPALPGAANKASIDSKSTTARINTEQTNASKSWADQMESNTPS